MTNEEAKKEIEKVFEPAFANYIIMALEQEPILDKIKQIVDRPIGNNAEEKAYNYMMIVKDIKEILDKHKAESVEQEPCEDVVIDKNYWKGFNNGIRTEKFRESKRQESRDDVMAIHTQGLDEGIRCAICTNSMKSDSGCDGGCMVDDEMYKKVMEVINKQMFELPTSDDCVSRQAVLDNAYAYGNGLEPEGYCVNVEDIQALPPITPTHKKEKWIEFNWTDANGICHWGIKCPKCLIKYKYRDYGKNPNYCPNCGKEMEV